VVSGDPVIVRLLFALAVVMLLLGAVTAWTSANVIKRIAGLVVAMLGALAGLAAFAAPPGMMLVGAAAAFAQIVIGVALIVRLQEAYGGLEAAELDAADLGDEPAEPKT